MKAFLQISALAVAIVAPLGGLVAYDRSEITERFEIGRTWNGDSAIFAYEDGRIFKSTKGENIGYFGGGRPRLVAFGCEGADSPLIAMEESDLPLCKRIERIAGAPSAKWSR